MTLRRGPDGEPVAFDRAGLVEDVSVEELAAALARWAKGALDLEAAVALLATAGPRPGFWLHRGDFRRVCLDLAPADDPAHRLWARFDAAACARALRRRELPGSGGELRLLHLICQLAGHLTDEPLADLVMGLGGQLALVLDAIAHAADWHESHLRHTVTGTPNPTSADTLTQALIPPALRHLLTTTDDDTTAGGAR